MSDECTVLFSRKLVKQFILKYKELVCLWHKHAPNYKSKKDRIDAITQLTRLVQSYDPAATRVHVLRKIDSLRACVRREYRRVTDSRKVAKSESEVYVPQLWYYSLFSFVLDLEEVKEVESTPSSPEPQAVHLTMPRVYIRKKQWVVPISEAMFKEAQKLIKDGKSQRAAAAAVGISATCLRKRLKIGSVATSMGRFKPTFNIEQEIEFAKHCKDMDDRFFGVTITDLRRLAYEYAEANEIENRFDKSSRMAGRDWVESFLKRNPQLALSPAASLVRPIGFNKEQVDSFYKNLKELYAHKKIAPSRVYNMDETGTGIVPNKPVKMDETVPKKTPKVVARKGKKVVGNDDVFDETDFAPSTATDQESSEEEAVDSEGPAYDEIKVEPCEAECLEYIQPSTSSRLEEPRKKMRRGPDSAAVGDEYDAIGINVAAKLRNLPDHMRILAEKLIGDVLFQAQTNGLTSASALVTPDPFR